MNIDASIGVNAGEMTRESKPAHGVDEWAKGKVNYQDGCSHACRYCYANAMAARFHRAAAASWCHPVIRAKAVNKSYRKREGRIMLPTSHDITPDNLTETLLVLRKLLQAGNELLIVSKPHLDCVKALCADLTGYTAQMLFRFTIGSADDTVLRYWEPGAPAFAERLAALKWAFEQGYSTSVSCEPMLDLHIDKVITAAMPYVTDAIWLGRVNQLRQAISKNCPGDDMAGRMADQLLAEQTDDYLRELYHRYKVDPRIKYKDSIKKAAGLDRPTEAGLDV